MKETILVLALVGCMAPCAVMAQAAEFAPAGTRISTEDSQPAQSHPDAAVAPDQGAEALLNLVQRQVLAGHTMAPDGDNAIFTWKRLLKVIVPRSPASTKALNDFVAVSRQRAADEQAAGRMVTARELSIFADEASDMLKGDRPEPPAASAAPLAAAPEEVRHSDAAMAPPPVQAPQAPAPRVQANDQPSSDTVAADVRGHVAPPAAKPPALPAEPRGADSPVKTESRTPETLPDRPSVAATAPRPADRQPAPDQAALAAAALSRGDAMLAMKNIAAARSLYEYAANAGNARAAAALAETYDPAFLTRFGAIGPRPDPGLAAEWYRRAAALGDRSAVARLETLRADVGK